MVYGFRTFLPDPSVGVELLLGFAMDWELEEPEVMGWVMVSYHTRRERERGASWMASWSGLVLRIRWYEDEIRRLRMWCKIRAHPLFCRGKGGGCPDTCREYIHSTCCVDDQFKDLGEAVGFSCHVPRQKWGIGKPDVSDFLGGLVIQIGAPNTSNSLIKS